MTRKKLNVAKQAQTCQQTSAESSHSFKSGPYEVPSHDFRPCWRRGWPLTWDWARSHPLQPRDKFYLAQPQALLLHSTSLDLASCRLWVGLFAILKVFSRSIESHDLVHAPWPVCLCADWDPSLVCGHPPWCQTQRWSRRNSRETGHPPAPWWQPASCGALCLCAASAPGSLTSSSHPLPFFALLAECCARSKWDLKRTR